MASHLITQCLEEMLKTAGESIKACPSKSRHSYRKNRNSDILSPGHRKKGLHRVRFDIRCQGPNAILLPAFTKAHVHKIVKVSS